MGKDTFGRQRLEKLLAGVMERDKRYGDAYTIKPEADFAQEHLDAELRSIWGNDLVPFYERQPDIKHIKY